MNVQDALSTAMWSMRDCASETSDPVSPYNFNLIGQHARNVWDALQGASDLAAENARLRGLLDVLVDHAKALPDDWNTEHWHKVISAINEFNALKGGAE